MATEKELRKAFQQTYTTIIGRNIYSQDLRQYVYVPYKDGKYYSDCSSSGCATYKKIGVDISASLNTAAMHNKGRKVNIGIVDGHIIKEDVPKLKIGMSLMFRGSDPSRPLQIGHVEYVYNIAGSSEDQITICGHGSGVPSLKNLKDYCSSRYAAKAPNGLRKMLIEVLDFIPEDPAIERPIDATMKVVAVGGLNVRSGAGTHAEVVGSVGYGTTLHLSKQTLVGNTYWFYCPAERGWLSGNYLQGWIKQDGQYWYMKGNGTYAKSEIVDDYILDKNGWMITPDRLASDGKIIY